MENKERITRVSAEEAQAMVAPGESLTDWAKVDGMSQADYQTRINAVLRSFVQGWQRVDQLQRPK